jgi:prevent-host-death family protein
MTTTSSSPAGATDALAPPATESLSVRQQRQNLSVHLRRVRAGQVLRVTDNGRPVALLSPLPAQDDVLDQLLAVGLATPAEGELLELLPPPPLGEALPMSTAEALRLEREDRL